VTGDRVADVVSVAAFVLLTTGFLVDLRITDKGGQDPAGHSGLPWTRIGMLGLWAGIAVRMSLASHGQDPVLWLTLVPALAFTAQLHLLHVQGWKGAPARAAGRVCWVISLAALGLELIRRS
jgi:hypothetical protein